MPKPILAAPPIPFAPKGLPKITVNAKQLFRISRRDTNEPYFSHTPTNRFDDPGPGAELYQVCYVGFEVHTAFAETVLHDEVPIHGEFLVGEDQLSSRYVLSFKGDDLVLADLTGPDLLRLGGNGALSAMLPYDIPKLWAKAVYDHVDQVDGFRYVSRNCNTGFAAVLFDRAQPKFKSSNAVPFLKHPEADAILKLFNVDMQLDERLTLNELKQGS